MKLLHLEDYYNRKYDEMNLVIIQMQAFQDCK